MASEIKRLWKDSQSERSGGQRPREERGQSVPGEGSIVKAVWCNLGSADSNISGFGESNLQTQLFVKAKVKDFEKPGQDQVQRSQTRTADVKLAATPN